MITGVENRNEEIEFYKESKEIFKDTSMNLREWMTIHKKSITKPN